MPADGGGGGSGLFMLGGWLCLYEGGGPSPRPAFSASCDRLLGGGPGGGAMFCCCEI
jgi:hypothetical protein